jgi:hypothetical protein
LNPNLEAEIGLYLAELLLEWKCRLNGPFKLHYNLSLSILHDLVPDARCLRATRKDLADVDGHAQSYEAAWNIEDSMLLLESRSSCGASQLMN